MEEEMTKLTKDEVEKDIKVAEEVEKQEEEIQKTEREELKALELGKAKTEEKELKELEQEKAETEKEASQVPALEKVQPKEEVRKELEVKKAKSEKETSKELEQEKTGPENEAPKELELKKTKPEKEVSKESESEKAQFEKEKSKEEELKGQNQSKEATKALKPKKAEPIKEAQNVSALEKAESKALESEKKEIANNKDLDEEGVIKKSHKKAKIAVIAFVVVVLITLGCLYARGVYYYKRNFFPQYKINSINCGNLTLQEAIDKLQQWYRDNYSLKLVDRNGEEMAVVLPTDIQMIFPIEEEMLQILEEQNAYKWFFYIFSRENFSREIVLLPEYDIAALESLLVQKGLFDVSCREEPQNAYIGEYQEDLKQFEIVPDKEGTILEQERTVMCAAEALTGLQDSLNLYETGCFKVAQITADNKQLKEQLENLNRVVGACITYDWNGTQEVVDGELIHQWLVFDGEDIILDEEEIAAYVAQKAKEHDTYGKKRKFVTTSGLTLTLPSGAYGWKTDKNAETEALIKLILEGAVTEREPIYSCQGWAKGDDDIGDSYVEINLTDQHLYLYVEGELILETDFVSGNVANGNSTPAGVFGLTYKTKNAVLRGPDYETPVNYWMPFNGNIGMHDATWRRSFGGDIYLTNGSHGCINLPLKMAKSIYGYISAGFPVICYYY